MSAQRSPTASIRSAIVRSVNVCGATSPFLDFLPRARRRDGRAFPGANRIRRGERRAVSVAPGIDEDAPAAIGLAELLRQSLRIARHQHRADLVRELVDVAEVRLAVQRHDDVKALGAGGLDPALESRARSADRAVRALPREAPQDPLSTDRDRRHRCQGG